ncbi:hypothetical protein L1987_15156 [Smallanthus sonchifolius]|uniref:Uncharacterized protein n=1 Tax=Smallanthus sonchifolius TaxID=185202 RepID=A0ACB9J8B1_9ASTR|nr:hypothetical protein L1987_15156 [Smallanthus sonchifolius]
MSRRGRARLWIFQRGHARSQIAGNRDHPYLEFDMNEHEYEARLDVLWPRRGRILDAHRFEPAAIDAIGQRDRWNDLVTAPWRRVFRLHAIQYIELMMEFFSTYQFDYPCADLELPETVRFRLGGEWRVMSVARFGRLLGLYTGQELQTELFTEGITEFPTEEDKDQFWYEFGFGIYDPSLTKASSLRDPLHRVLHRCIVYSISGRGQGETVVNLRELFYLYCLVRPRTCNLAHSIAGYLVNSSGCDVTSAICGGHFMTKLARNFQLLTNDLIGDQPPPPPPPPPPPVVVIPHDMFMIYWAWQYEVQCAAAAAGGAPYVVPLPFFMQSKQQPEQPPPSPPYQQPPPSPPHHLSPPPSSPAAGGEGGGASGFDLEGVHWE